MRSLRSGASARPFYWIRGSRRPPGVDHVDLLEPARYTTMAHRVRLGRLALPVIETRTKLIALRSADHVHRVPEIGSPHLVRDIFQHSRDLAVANLVEDLAAE